MDLHEDGRFVLVRVNPKSREFGEMIFDVPVDALRVGGAGTYLILTAEGRKKRIDFATRSAVGPAAFGVIGYAIASSYATAAGRPAWVDFFKQRGLLLKFDSGRRLKALLIILGVLVGIALAFAAIYPLFNH